MARINKSEALKKDREDGFYAEYDEEFDTYGVFGLETGFCYGQHGVKECAEEHAERLTEQTAKYRDDT